MPSPSNASFLIIARFVFVFLNIISISEVSKKNKHFQPALIFAKQDHTLLKNAKHTKQRAQKFSTFH